MSQHIHQPPPAFEICDADNNQQIDFNELKEVLLALGEV